MMLWKNQSEIYQKVQNHRRKAIEMNKDIDK